MRCFIAKRLIEFIWTGGEIVLQVGLKKIIFTIKLINLVVILILEARFFEFVFQKM
jgi:hypothetical protein